MVAALLAVCASGCVTQREYYLPKDQALANEGHFCGHVPYGGLVLSDEGVTIAIDISPKGDSIALSLQSSVDKGATLRFLSDKVSLHAPLANRTASSTLAEFRVGTYGTRDNQASTERIAAVGRLEGRGRNEKAGIGRDLFISSAVVGLSPEDRVVLWLPEFEVNGSRRPARGIELVMMRRTGMLTCIQ
jgi:hypothetical protein